MYHLDNLIKNFEAEINDVEKSKQIILEMQALICKLFDGIYNLSSAGTIL